MEPTALAFQSTKPPPHGKWLGRLARVLIIGALFYFILVSLWRNWGELREHEFALDWRRIGLSWAFFGLYLLNRGLIWHWMTRKFGCSIPVPNALAAWFYSLLGKYVPGKLFLLAGRVHLYHLQGRSPLRISMAFMLESICVLLANILVLLVAPLFADLPLVARYRGPALILVAFFLLAIRPRHMELTINPLLRLARRPPISLPIRYRDMLAVVVVFAINWLLLGVGLYLLVSAIYPVRLGYLFYLCGSFALASTIGILALFAPAGIGVREAVLVVALSAIMPQALAVVVTLASRVWMTVGELAAVGVVALAVRLSSRAPATGAPVQDPLGRHAKSETTDERDEI